ncbi:hypothetical protein BASA81_007906 [Batrachochytrium salamandrivorans]|nr:hypothetical protein BASA81_007906 [Batrachochytrium salamandrivorans]
MSSARSRSGNGEYTQGDVDYLVRELVRLNINKVTKEYPDPPTTPRAAHTKCIGLLKGTFKINDNVPAELHHGCLHRAMLSSRAILGNEAPVSIAQEEDVVAVKYMLRPSRDNGHGAVLAQVHGENYLRNELEAHLGTKHTLSWAFCIQRRTNKKQMPLNDASVVWTSEFVQVATLTIEDQDFTTSQRFELAEALSFNLKKPPTHAPTAW